MAEIKYFEHEGVLYRGLCRTHPEMRWSHDQKAWVKTSIEVPTSYDFGTEIPESKANEMMARNER